MKTELFILVTSLSCCVIGDSVPASLNVAIESPLAFVNEQIPSFGRLENRGTNDIMVMTFSRDAEKGQICFSSLNGMTAAKRALMEKEFHSFCRWYAEPDDLMLLHTGQTCRVEIDPISLSFSATGTHIMVANFYLGNGEWIQSNTITTHVVVADEKYHYKTLTNASDMEDIKFSIYRYLGTNYVIEADEALRIAAIPVGKSFDINWDDRKRYAVVTVEGQTNTVYDVRMLRRIWPPVTIPQ